MAWWRKSSFVTVAGVGVEVSTSGGLGTRRLFSSLKLSVAATVGLFVRRSLRFGNVPFAVHGCGTRARTTFTRIRRVGGRPRLCGDCDDTSRLFRSLSG